MRAVFVIFLCAFLAHPSGAQTPTPFPEFTFKRVSPPTGNGPRINVQIAPTVAPEVPEIARPTPDVPGSGDPDVVAFWDALGTDISLASASRLERARADIRNRGIESPALQMMQEIASEHGRLLLETSIDTGVSPAFALAVIAIESSGRAEAVSSAGAQGLMQLIPATADRFGVEDAFNPAQNIAGGMAYLSYLLERFEGDALLALAGYNAGENAVSDASGVPNFAETRAYVPKVVAAWDVARSLCLTPPELPSDGCVFGVMATN